MTSQLGFIKNKGKLIQEQVSETENTLDLDKIVWKLETSRTRPRLAERIKVTLVKL